MLQRPVVLVSMLAFGNIVQNPAAAFGPNNCENKLLLLLFLAHRFVSSSSH